MPTSTGKTGPEGLIETLYDLADKWTDTDLGMSEGMFGAIAGEATLKECARDLRAVLDGYQAASS